MGIIVSSEFTVIRPGRLSQHFLSSCYLLPRKAMLARYMLRPGVCPSVFLSVLCSSVRPSQAGRCTVLSKR